MKRTPMSVARSIGNRKLTFAMIERDRCVTPTVGEIAIVARYVTRDSAYECEPALISETNQKAQGKHAAVPIDPHDKGSFLTSLTAGPMTARNAQISSPL